MLRCSALCRPLDESYRWSARVVNNQARRCPARCRPDSRSGRPRGAVTAQGALSGHHHHVQHVSPVSCPASQWQSLHRHGGGARHNRDHDRQRSLNHLVLAVIMRRPVGQGRGPWSAKWWCRSERVVPTRLTEESTCNALIVPRMETSPRQWACAPPAALPCARSTPSKAPAKPPLSRHPVIPYSAASRAVGSSASGALLRLRNRQPDSQVPLGA